MKTSLFFGVLLLFAGSAVAQDFVAPQTQRKRVPPPSKVVPRAPLEGAIPRVIRSGNPVQMLNPFAPKEYGSGADLVYHEQGDPFQRPPHKNPRGMGIKLFVVEF